MNRYDLVPLVGILSLFVGLPLILTGAGIARRFLKIKEKELDLRREELELERERVTVLRLLEESERKDKLLAETKREAL